MFTFIALKVNINYILDAFYYPLIDKPSNLLYELTVDSQIHSMFISPNEFWMDVKLKHVSSCRDWYCWSTFFFLDFIMLWSSQIMSIIIHLHRTKWPIIMVTRLTCFSFWHPTLEIPTSDIYSLVPGFAYQAFCWFRRFQYKKAPCGYVTWLQ